MKKLHLGALALLVGLSLFSLSACSIGGTSSNSSSKTEESKAAVESQASQETSPEDRYANLYYGQERTPEILVKSVKDDSTLVLSSLKGKVVLMNIGASWCPDCQREFVYLQKLYDEYKDNPDIAFVVTSVIQESKTDVQIEKKFMKENNYTFPHYYISGDEANQVMGLKYIPTMMIIKKDGNSLELSKDQEGKPRYYFIENFTEEDVRAAIANALKD